MTFVALIIYIVWVRHFESKKVLIVGMLLLTFRYIMEAGFYADFDNKIGISTKTYKTLEKSYISFIEDPFTG